MLSIQDVIDYCDLDRGEIEAIAEHEHLTVQQVIIRAVERMLDPRPADVPSTPGSSDHDIYQYGGGAASNV